MSAVAALKARRIKLSSYQKMVFRHESRFRVLVAGRRFGKTFLAIVELMTKAVNKPGSVNWYVAPTYKQAKEIAWLDLKRTVPREYCIGRPNESDLSIGLLNGSRIALKGADNYDSLRGPGLDLVVLDEFALIQAEAWSEVLRPALSDKQGSALFITSPRGFNWAYDFYLRGQSDDYPDWASWQFRTMDGGIVPDEEIDAARRTLDPRIFRQEYEASFETLHGRVYSNFDRTEHIRPIEPASDTVLVGMDFNVNPMSAVIAFRAADQCHVVDALEIQTSNTEEMAAEIRRRYPNRRIVVCPDPSGRRRITSAPVGQTDFTILERAGFEVHAPSSAPAVVDRINNVQANLRSADDSIRLFIDPRADKLIRGLDGMTYKEGTSQPDKTLGLDHITDALGYLLWQEFNVLKDSGIEIVPFNWM